MSIKYYASFETCVLCGRSRAELIAANSCGLFKLRGKWCNVDNEEYKIKSFDEMIGILSEADKIYDEYGGVHSLKEFINIVSTGNHRLTDNMECWLDDKGYLFVDYSDFG